MHLFLAGLRESWLLINFATWLPLSRPDVGSSVLKMARLSLGVLDMWTWVPLSLPLPPPVPILLPLSLPLPPTPHSLSSSVSAPASLSTCTSTSVSASASRSSIRIYHLGGKYQVAEGHELPWRFDTNVSIDKSVYIIRTDLTDIDCID